MKVPLGGKHHLAESVVIVAEITEVYQGFGITQSIRQFVDEEIFQFRIQAGLEKSHRTANEIVGAGTLRANLW